MPYQYQNQIPGLPAAIAPQGLPAGASAPQLPVVPQVAPAAPQVSALDQFLGNLANPTGNSQFLLDLGARLLQPRAKGSSQLGTIVNAGNQAVQGLTGRRAASAKVAVDSQLTASRLATEDLQRKKLGVDIAGGEAKQVADIAGQPLQDELTRSKIAKNKQQASKLSTGKNSSVVQAANAYGQVKFNLYGPGSAKQRFDTLDQAVEEAYKEQQPVGKDPDAWYAQAVAKYMSEAPVSGASPEEQKRVLAGFDKIRDTWKYGEGGKPTAASAEVPPAVQAGLQKFKTGIDPDISEKTAIVEYYNKIASTPEEAYAMYQKARGGQQQAPATTPSPQGQAEAEAEAPQVDTAQQELAAAIAEREAADQKDAEIIALGGKPPPRAKNDKVAVKRAEIKAKKAEKEAAKEKQKAEIAQAVEDLNYKVPVMTATEARVFLLKHEKTLTPPMVRRIKQIIKQKAAKERGE